MSLPEKVRDVTQSEWLEVRERLAAAEANAERWRHDAGAARGRYSGALSALKRAEDVAEDARQVAEQVESQLAIAMTWGAEVCATVDNALGAAWVADSARRGAIARAEQAEAALSKLTAASGVPHGEVAAWLLGHPSNPWAETMAAELRAERAEADLAAARAQLAAVVAAVLPCSICHGRGVRETACLMCGDSTYEHECDTKVVPCPSPSCGDLRRVLADTAQAAREHDERVREEERERCAEECDAIGHRSGYGCAAVIRALGSRP